MKIKNSTIEKHLHKHFKEYHGVVFFDSEDNIMIKIDTSRWDKLIWYKKLIGYFFKTYKMKFVDFKPFGFKTSVYRL